MSVESQAVQILPGNIILILIFSSLPSLLILLFSRCETEYILVDEVRLFWLLDIVFY